MKRGAGQVDMAPSGMYKGWSETLTGLEVVKLAGVVVGCAWFRLKDKH